MNVERPLEESPKSEIDYITPILERLAPAADFLITECARLNLIGDRSHQFRQRQEPDLYVAVNLFDERHLITLQAPVLDQKGNPLPNLSTRILFLGKLAKESQGIFQPPTFELFDPSNWTLQVIRRIDPQGSVTMTTIDARENGDVQIQLTRKPAYEETPVKVEYCLTLDDQPSKPAFGYVDFASTYTPKVQMILYYREKSGRLLQTGEMEINYHGKTNLPLKPQRLWQEKEMAPFLEVAATLPQEIDIGRFIEEQVTSIENALDDLTRKISTLTPKKT